VGFAATEAAAHAEGGQQEDSVHEMLNTFSYDECPAPCPSEAVSRLFAGLVGAKQQDPDRQRERGDCRRHAR